MDIGLLESVQRCMTKMIQRIRSFSYERTLNHLKLYPLEYIVRGNLIEVFKWVMGDVGKFLKVSSQDRTKNNEFKLEKSRFRKDKLFYK